MVSLHNPPFLSLVSLMDIRFFLHYHSAKLLVIVTNFGGILYLVKRKKASKEVMDSIRPMAERNRQALIKEKIND